MRIKKLGKWVIYECNWGAPMRTRTYARFFHYILFEFDFKTTSIIVFSHYVPCILLFLM